MARLFDRLMVGGIYLPVAAAEDRRVSVLMGKVPEATVFDISNVVEHFHGGEKTAIPGQDNSWRITDFPNIAPPLDLAFYEFNTGFTAIGMPEQVRSVALLVAAMDARPNPTIVDPRSGEAHPIQDARWLMEVAFIVPEPGRGPALWARWFYGVKEDGTPAEGDKGHPYNFGLSYTEGDPDDRVGRLRMVHWARAYLYPTLLATSFMHCKNVERREVEQPRWDRREWRKKHKRPLVRYHVLDIDPMRKVLKHEGGSDVHGLKKALHICRGHFATYTEDAPLFGRVTGTFWKPQHVRGSAKSGAVVKDYNVKAPR